MPRDPDTELNNLIYQFLDPGKGASSVPSRPAERKTEGAASRQLVAADLERVVDALCLAGAPCGKTAVMHWMHALKWRRSDGRIFNGADADAALRTLAAARRINERPEGAWELPATLRRERLPTLLASADAPSWWRRWIWVANGATGSVDAEPRWVKLRSDTEAAALAMLLLASGIDAERYMALAGRVLGAIGSVNTVRAALTELLAIGELRRVNPSLLWRLLLIQEQAGSLRQAPALLGWLDRQIEQAPLPITPGMRVLVAEWRLHAGRIDAMRHVLAAESLCASFEPLMNAAAAAHAGRWSEAAAGFAAALKALAAALGRRRDLASPSLMQWYVIALLAQPDAAAWTAARKLCITESGTRTPSAYDAWGRWAHAIAVRLGDARFEAGAFLPPDVHYPRHPSEVADRLILAAWLNQPLPAWASYDLAALAAELHRIGLPWKADLLAEAAERLGLPEPARPVDAPPRWAPRFFALAQDPWREALAAIVALGGGPAAGGEAAAPALTWRLRLDDEGRVQYLMAFERGTTARAQLKPVPLAKLEKRIHIAACDVAVVRCIGSQRHRPSASSFDLVAAAQALVGHPALELADAPGIAVDLRESLPVLQVLRQRNPDGSECFVFELEDRLIANAEPVLAHQWVDDDQYEDEIERRDSLRIVRESPERARLIRISAAQRRVAELVAKRWSVPVTAHAELDAALRVLSGHFVLHSDAQAGEPVPSDARLLAQLLPRGDAIELRFVVRPFGDFGPVLAPGTARSRLMTMHQGISLTTLRDLDAERAHFNAVLEALPFLGEPPPDATWLLDDPEQALAAVQTLGRMCAVGAGPSPDAPAAPIEEAASGAALPEAQRGADTPVRALEWPRGKPLRVIDAGARSMKLALRSASDWFMLDGELALDEDRVLSLQRLLDLLREAGSQRFIALGEGRYLALTERLRQRLAELDALAEADGAGFKLSAAASGWLAEAAADLGARGDQAWRERAERLEAAAAAQPQVPAALQAQLRPYQHEGYVWMMRLAAAGFGACLADDMGLGKTVQTLALLLARAGEGPVLVVAPTSVCANWLAEAERFAPALRAAAYGDGERAAQITQAAAGDLVVVSYALLLRDAEAFAEREWATLVLDEAQALKNAATQRAKAVGALRAGFRVALSGTPVENRLADLWSIMNILNPGLLGNANRFAIRFAAPIERQRNEAARARLRRLVAPFLLRRTKAQVLTDLPPRTEIVHRIEPGAEERAFLEALRRSALERVATLDIGDSSNTFNVLTELTRLRRAACDPRLAAPELDFVGAKVQAFEALATELVEARHKALVFSQFTDFLKLLAARLDAAGLRYQYLDGSTPAAVRAERVAAFQRGEGDLFLISLKAGGFGLNLTAADYVVITDPWWNPAAEDQAMGRAHRIGQQRPVTVYRLVTAGSIEERIVGLHHDKRELAEGLLADQEGGAPLRADELLALLRE